MIPFTPDERRAQFAPSQVGGNTVAEQVQSIIGAPTTPTMAEQVDFAPPTSASVKLDVADIVNADRTALMSSLMHASRINPDKAAEAQRLAQQTGVGQDIALRNMDELRQRAFMSEMQQRDLANTNPILAQYLKDREFASQASDDVGVLSNIETIVQPFREEVERIVPDTYQPIGLTPSSPLFAPSLVFPPLMMLPNPIDFGAVGTELYKGFRRGRLIGQRGTVGTLAALGLDGGDLNKAAALQKEMQELGRLGLLGTSAEMVGQMYEMKAEMLTGAAAGATVGSAFGPKGTIVGGGFGVQAGMVTGVAKMEAGNLYADMVADGVSPEIARNTALVGGFINGLIELASFKILAAPFKQLTSKLLKEGVHQALRKTTMRSAVTAAAKSYGLQIGANAGQEALQEAVAIVAEEVARASDGLDPKTSASEAVNRILESAVYGAAGASILGAIGPGANLVYDINRANRTVNENESFADLARNGKNAKLATRNPRLFERFLRRQVQGTRLENVYIDAATARTVLAQAGVTATQIDAVIPGFSQQLAEAAAVDGGTVIIPSEQYIARLDGTAIGDALSPHIRASADGYSLTEANALLRQRQQMMAEANEVLAQQSAAEGTFVEEANAIKDQFVTALKNAGRDELQANAEAAIYQAIIVTQASEAKMTPNEWMQRYGLREVTGADMPAATLEQANQFDQAGQRRTDTPEFKAWSNNAPVVASEQSESHEFKTGTPVVVEALHGSTERGLRRFDVGRAVEVPGAIFFTSNPAVAEQYTYERAYGEIISDQPTGDVIRAYVAFANPMVYQPKGKVVDAIEMGRAIEQAKAAGHDGLIIKNIDDSIGMTGDMGDVYVTWNPTSIKSVDNRGTWSRTTANIMEQASRIDADYMAAVERGDMETAQRMVYEAARAAGYTLRAFHGTDAEPFTVFGNYDSYNFGDAAYFSPTEQYARIYAESHRTGRGQPRILNVVLRVNNTFSPESNAEHLRLYRKWTKEAKRVKRHSAFQVWGPLAEPYGENKVRNLVNWEDQWWLVDKIREAGFDSFTTSESDGETIAYGILNPNQIKLADPVTYDEAGNIVPLSRRFNLTSPKLFEQAAMSTRVPTAVKPLENALNDVLLADFPTFLRDEQFVAKNLARFKELNAPIRIDSNATERQQLEQIIEHMTSNLLWLHDAIDPAIRERARMWYVGGRRLVDWLAKRHGMSPMGAATVFAVLSPQKNWYENVGLGIRIIDIVATQRAATMNAEMQDAYLNSLRKAQTKLERQLAKHDNAKPKRGKKAIADWAANREDLIKEVKAAGDKVAEAQDNIKAIGKRTLADLLRDRDFFLAAIMVRWFDQTKNDRTYPVISPEGGVGAPMLTEDGTPANIRYGSYNEVAKAIAAYVDGRAENVHYLIGGEHKVRNFYNNLFNPEDPRFATIDTHAIAAAYLMPLAGTDKLVQHGLGGGVGNAMFGMGGGYAVFYEAYRRAAQARGIQPREMQSITWEAIRGMFEAAMKGGLKAPVAATWKRYVDGEIDIDAARADVMQRAGGITTPSWVTLPTDMQPAAGYEGVSRTAADEQAKRIAAQPTAASVMFEVAPDPINANLVRQWEALSPQQRQAISVRVAQDIIPRILREYGMAADMVMQVGGWEGATNVGFALRMPPGPLVRQIAQAVGYALSQQAVFTLSVSEFEGSEKADIVVLKLQPGTTVEQIGDLYAKKLYPLGIQGHATVQDSMIISLDSGVDGAMLADTIAQAVAEDGRIVEITHATGWRSLDETRIPDKAAREADEGRRVEGIAGRRRVDAYRSEATRLVAEYISDPERYQQAARDTDSNRFDQAPVSPISFDVTPELVKKLESGLPLFQAAKRGPRGGLDPERLRLLLTTSQDSSTVIHELAHFLLVSYSNMARDGNATPQMLADLDELLRWRNVAGDSPQQRLTTWLGMSIDQQRTALHEALAYSFEVYVMEGKAPTAELQSVFDRLRLAMLRVYRTIRDDINRIYRENFGEDLPMLTPEVRGVFDRMLASREAIQRQATIDNMKALFQTQEQSGMNDQEWAAYQAMETEAIEASVTDLTTASLRQMQWLGNARSSILRDLQKKHDAARKEVASEVAAVVRARPVYRAMTYLRYGKFVDADGQEIEIEGTHKLDLDTVRAMYEFLPEGQRLDITALSRGKYGLVGKDGLNPDLLAEAFGYSSGDQMIRELLAARPIRDEIADQTDMEMTRRYGDMNNAQAQEMAVQSALHNEARARFVAVELRFLAKATEPVRLMLEAARQVAQSILADKRLRDIRPSDYVAGEARAARDAKTIIEDRAKRDTDAAQERAKAFESKYGSNPEQQLVRAKRAQLYQNQLAKESMQIAEQVDADIKYLRRVLRDTNVKRMGADAADQIAQLLQKYELAAVTLKRLDARQSLKDYLAQQEADGLLPDIAPEVIAESNRVNYRELTVRQFRDLVEAVKQIEYIGKNQRTVQLAAQRAEYEQKRDEVVARIREVGAERGLSLDPRSPLTNIGRSVAALRGFAAQHLKAASVAYILDGGRDDGPLWNLVIRTANAASDMETSMRAEASSALATILKPVFALGSMGGNGVYFESIGRSLNREARIAIALNTGNAGNMQRLLDGEGWTMDQVQPILESLTEAEWNAVQQVWDYINTYKPLIAEKERRLYGKEPNWVEPQPLTVRTADGKTVTLAGGYYPVKYDPVASDRVANIDEVAEAKRALDGAYTAATTRRSFTKSRAVRPDIGPLLYTLDAAFGGINDVIHDLAWHEWLIQTQRLLRDPKFKTAVTETRGPEFLKQLRDWAKDNAAGERKIGVAGEAALSWLRKGISAAGLGFNVISAALQITGFNQSIVKVGARYVGRGIAQFVSSPIDTALMVTDKSAFMRERSRTQFREINEIRNRVRGQTAVARRVTAGTYFLMMKMQRTVDIPTWLGAYQKALDGGKDDATAVALADQAVRDTQGSGLLSDLSAIERGGPMMKLFTVFYAYMNTVYNMAAMQTMTSRSKGKLAADYVMLFVVPVVLGQAIRSLLQPNVGDDEPDLEKLARKLAAEELSYLMGTMVIAREFGGAAQLLTGAEGVRMGYGGPAGLRAVGEVYGLATQAGQLEFDRAFRRSAINTLGAFTGLPSAQINRTIDGIEAVIEGEVKGVEAFVAPLTGVRRQ